MRFMFSRGKSTLIHNLSSFLQYATVDPASTVYRGTLFEWQTHEALERLGMRLRRVGGKSDGGVDLRGTWPHFNVNVLVQCKNTKLGSTPDTIRSLIGASAMHDECVAILSTSSSKRYTPDVLSHFMDSQLPLALARVERDQIDSLLFNRAAEERLDGLSAVTQFNDKGEPTLVLMHHGRILECI
ncbi:hypothetical protein BJV82DRAFT_668821 [Fennellomyces sp. T-0311]|nr:hypothetical protein BJV82DRAFT_668821 [Fennellomyces sp. T-0311]